jgi:anti-sigma factor RsiW
MEERTNIPDSPDCSRWETLLTDALDGLLGPEDEAMFNSHKVVCPSCSALYEEARKGREWLEFLSPEPEVPEGLLDKILSATGPAPPNSHQWQHRALPAGAGHGYLQPATHPRAIDPLPGHPVWQQPGFLARMSVAIHPRLLMTAAMAFFSIALTLNLTGVRLSNVHLGSVRLPDLRPRAVRSYMERQLAEASVPIARFYDHLQWVNEVESRVREIGGRNESESVPQQNQAEPENPGQTMQRPAKPMLKRNPGTKGTREQVRHIPIEPLPIVPIQIQEAALAQEKSLSPETNFSLQGMERSTRWIV